MYIRVWVLAADGQGQPSLMDRHVDVSENEYSEGRHYELAIGLVKAAGYDTASAQAFDEKDPAGRLMDRLERGGGEEQASAHGNKTLPVWCVPVTVDATMSARVHVHATDAGDAIEQARTFAAEPDSIRFFSVDEGNYRGRPDFYCPDSASVTPVAGP
jgi:hypothetical protein